MSLAVSEIYGCFQGEGPSAGRRAVLLRLHGCNLTCSWCDTPWTWDPDRVDPRRPGTEMHVEDVVQAIHSLSPDALIVISGGEPLMQVDDLWRLTTWLPYWREIEVETNGTKPAPKWFDRCKWNVSPKLANSGRASRLHPSWRHPDIRFKFVVRTVADVQAVAQMQLEPNRVWIMPEGTTGRRILHTARLVESAVADAGFNLSLRQHILLFGDEPGR